MDEHLTLPEQEVKRNHVVTFDVDDTLVIWGKTQDEGCLSFNNWGYPQALLPHAEHIFRLKEHHAAGHFIIVWSQGGYEWAQEVVNVLGLAPYVDLVIAKPFAAYDDIHPREWFPNPHYLKQKE
jgi:FMN phosphatase YigB (HAD superfamily)